MLRQLPFALALGLSSAVLYAAALSGSPLGIFLAYLAVLPLFMVGLSIGLGPLVIAAGAAAVGIGAFGGVMPGVLYGLSHALPAVVMVVLGLRNVTWSDGKVYWYPPGRLVQALAIWCGSVVVLTGLGLSLFGSGFEDSVVGFIQAMAKAFMSQGQPILDADSATEVAVLLPGIVAWSWMVMVSLNALAAQGLLRKAGRALRPSPLLAEVVIGPAWVVGFGVFAIAGVAIPGDLGFGAVNLAIIMAFPLFFQGLSVAHALFAHWGVGSFVIWLFYVLMVLLSWTALAVVALGLAEPLVRIRARLAGRQNT